MTTPLITKEQAKWLTLLQQEREKKFQQAHEALNDIQRSGRGAKIQIDTSWRGDSMDGEEGPVDIRTMSSGQSKFYFGIPEGPSHS